ncbi:zinc finger, CCHC-type containing protein [Tanacetum coccineum]|uniref:Zinc finger, CCHC-type containing protein n=1 Tax=Tanacetum coccineum TaxID=301880 RepID=A0ABQ5EBW5_9ASTR
MHNLCQDNNTSFEELDDKNIPIILLMIEEGLKSSSSNPKGNRNMYSRGCKVMETKTMGLDTHNNRGNKYNKTLFEASCCVEGVDNGNTTQVNSKSNDNTYEEQQPITAPDSPITPPTYTYNPDSEEAEEATSSSTKRSENGFDDTSVRGFKDLTEIYENARDVETKNLLFTKEEPCNYKEASTDKKWIEAMEIELDLVNKNNIWTLTTLPTNHKAIGLKWVFNTKRDAKGEIIKYKARLVAKGCLQEQGIDFDEVFALVACIKIVHLILALAAYHGWQVHHLDVKSAFLYGDLMERYNHADRKYHQYHKETTMMDSNDMKIPMDPGTKYLLHTRPDHSYSVGLLSIFMQDPKDHHLKAIKQVIRYIKGTKEHGIIYKKEGGCKITGYSDQ